MNKMQSFKWITLCIFYLISTNLKAFYLDTPANEYYKRFSAAQDISEKNFEYSVQLKTMPELKTDSPTVYHVIVEGLKIHVTPVIPLGGTLSEWEIVGNKVVQWRIENKKRIRVTGGSLQTKVFKNVELRDLLFTQWTSDYEAKLMGGTSANAILELKRKKQNNNLLPYSKIQVTMERMSYLPNHMDFYESGKLTKSYHYLKYLPMRGKYHPKIMEIIDHRVDKKTKNSQISKLTYFQFKRVL